MTEVRVKASNSYPILIDGDLLKVSGSLIREEVGGGSACIVCGDEVAKLYASKVGESLKSAGYDTHLFVYPHGERSKTPEMYVRLLNYMAENGITRSDIIVALGGGVTGDLAGFAAATYMRGIRYVQIPTTLLAMVDSSVGGKTAVDLPSGKNLAGAFWQPEMVLCDHSTLETLPRETFIDGCAEVVKYGILKDPEILSLVLEPERNIERIIEKCVTIKRDIVQEDERDNGKRALLNLGHTAAHSIEKLSQYAVPHGKAVAIGLAIIARAAEANGDCDKDTADFIIKILSKLSLPTTSMYRPAEIADAIAHDKKRSGESISLIIPRALGDCEIRRLTLKDAREYLIQGV